MMLYPYDINLSSIQEFGLQLMVVHFDLQDLHIYMSVNETIFY